MADLYSFIIPLSSLREKVEMHTSVLGKHRSGEDSPHLLEQFALTEGESFLFDSYLKEAAAKTYNWIKAFGRNVQNAYMVHQGGGLVERTEEDDVHIIQDGVRLKEPHTHITIGESMYTSTQSGDTCNVHIDLPLLQLCLGDATGLRYHILVHYVTIADELFTDALDKHIMLDITNDVQLSSLDLSLTISQDEFPTRLERIDYVDISIDGFTPASHPLIKSGEFVKYTFMDGSVKYGIQRVNSTEVDVNGWYDFDIRDCVIFRVELPEWNDRNMLPAAKEHLESALANYIMYRWFEEVQEDAVKRVGNQWKRSAKLSDTFYAKWEEDAHAAQLALNSERRILQRKSTWL